MSAKEIVFFTKQKQYFYAYPFSEMAIQRIQWIKSISEMIHSKWKIAFAVFTLANVIFFIGFFSIAEDLKNKICQSNKKLTTEEKQFTNFMIDFIIFGGSAFLYNVLLSRGLNYQLSKLALTAITVIVVSLRIILRSNN